MGGIHPAARGHAVALTPRRPRPGFTMVELMVVILIIGVVVAIVFPVLSGARIAARKAATNALMTDIANASQSFYTDHNRFPGYFSPTEMGNAENEARGFTAMENIMLDLAGGLTSATSDIPGNGNPCDELNGPRIVQVGPTGANRVRVDISLIGAPSESNKRYWTPDKRYYARQCVQGQQEADNAHKALPDVVDAWGTPILAWVQDDPGVAQTSAFAAQSFTPGSNNRARYYWASNAGFLKSQNLGRLGRNQVRGSAGADSAYSLISNITGHSQDVTRSLAGLLGHPSYPNGDQPRVGRAPIVFHSAGADGYYLGSLEARRGGSTEYITYNPTPPNPQPGAPIPRQPDPMEIFDDLIVNAGNN